MMVMVMIMRRAIMVMIIRRMMIRMRVKYSRGCLPWAGVSAP